MGLEVILLLELKDPNKNKLSLFTIGNNSVYYNYLSDINGVLTLEKIREIEERINEEILNAKNTIDLLKDAYNNIKNKTPDDFCLYISYYSSKKGILEELEKRRDYLSILFEIKKDLDLGCYDDRGFSDILLEKEDDGIHIYLTQNINKKELILSSYTGGSMATTLLDSFNIPYWEDDSPEYKELGEEEVHLIKTKYLNNLEEARKSIDSTNRLLSCVNSDDIYDINRDLIEQEKEKEILIDVFNQFQFIFDIVNEIKLGKNDFSRFLLIKSW